MRIQGKDEALEHLARYALGNVTPGEAVRTPAGREIEYRGSSTWRRAKTGGPGWTERRPTVSPGCGANLECWTSGVKQEQL
jgi:hypothetical protein